MGCGVRFAPQHSKNFVTIRASLAVAVLAPVKGGIECVEVLGVQVILGDA